MTFFVELQWRGLIKDVSSPDLEEKLNDGGLNFYIGADPTAESLHIGQFPTFLMVERLKRAGHHPFILVGGATGRVGDPRGTGEREKAEISVIEHNYEKIKKQIKKLFGDEVQLVNNYDWFKNMNYIDFLRDVGKYINVNYMLNKDIINRRLDTGITYAEFSYMLMQGYDFLKMYETMGCTMQVEGSDQWGNITTGIDLIRKIKGKEAYAFTIPLILDATGKKFGKSEGNALWLDQNKTSSYALYQYLLNSDDSKVFEYLKVFTFLTPEEIMNTMEEHNKEPHLRKAQKMLAKCVVTDLRGEEEYERALKLTDALFNNKFDDLTKEEIEEVFKGEEVKDITIDTNVVDFLITMGVCSSKREAKEFILGNAITINGTKINDIDTVIDNKYLIDNTYVIVKRGKKKYYLGKIK